MSDEDPFAALRTEAPGPSGLPGTMREQDRAARIPGAAIAVLAVLVLVVAGAGFAVFAFVGGETSGNDQGAAPAVADPVEEAEGAVDETGAAPPAPAEPEAGTTVGGNSSAPPAPRPKRPAADPFSAAAVSAALATIRREAGGKPALLSLRIDRDRVIFTGRGQGGKLAIVTVPRSGEPSVVRTGGPAPPIVIPIARIDARAPSRILKATGRRKALSYFAASPNPVSGTIGWSAFFTSGSPPFVSAGSDGRNPKAPGG